MEEVWVHLFPDKFTNFVGSISLLIALFCMCMTFNEKHKSHATKLFAIMVVVSLAFFSSHWGTYFAAIFIVATAVTELDFLQNLAAIISKDKNYFDYRKEALSKEQNIKRKAEEIVEEEFKSTLKKDKSVPNNSSEINIFKIKDLPHSSIMRMAFDVEDKVLNFLSKKYGQLERGVRLTGGNESIEVDGLISDRKGPKKVFEIKWTRNARNVRPIIMSEFSKIHSIRDKFKAITGYVPEYNLVIVVNEETDIQKEKWSNTLLKAENENIIVSFVTLEEIGFTVAKINA
jgi:hypothetical protein